MSLHIRAVSNDAKDSALLISVVALFVVWRPIRPVRHNVLLAVVKDRPSAAHIVHGARRRPVPALCLLNKRRRLLGGTNSMISLLCHRVPSHVASGFGGGVGLLVNLSGGTQARKLIFWAPRKAP